MGVAQNLNRRGLHRFWSMFPLTRVPFWYRFFEPQPNGIARWQRKNKSSGAYGRPAAYLLLRVHDVTCAHPPENRDHRVGSVQSHLTWCQPIWRGSHVEIYPTSMASTQQEWGKDLGLRAKRASLQLPRLHHALWAGEIRFAPLGITEALWDKPPTAGFGPSKVHSGRLRW